MWTLPKAVELLLVLALVLVVAWVAITPVAKAVGDSLSHSANLIDPNHN